MKNMGNAVGILLGNSEDYIDELSDNSDFDEADLEQTPAPLQRSHRATNFTTDAAPRIFASLPQPESTLNFEKINEIENELDEYEIVSLMYLLCEENQFNLQELSMKLRDESRKLLENWARHEAKNDRPWAKKFVEALCIIQNFKILKQLGYNKQSAIEHYLPHQPSAALHVNKMRKVCYTICEKMNKRKTTEFIELVNRDIQTKKVNFNREYNGEYNYLEMYFLEWELLGYITPNSLSNIRVVLKLMEEDSIYNIISESALDRDVESSNAQIINQVNKGFEKDMNPLSRPEHESFLGSGFSSLADSTLTSHSPPKFNRMTGLDNNIADRGLREFIYDQEYISPSIHNSYISENLKYSIDPNNPGVVLIINQQEFYTEYEKQYQHLLPPKTSEKLESRSGTEKDGDDLKNIFEKFGFKVIVENNLTHIDMVSKIKDVLKSITNEASLFICILSHGDKGIVYGSNSCRVRVSGIQKLICKINKINLQGKPKILMLQSCQGQQCQKINDSSSGEEDSSDDDSSSLTTDNVNGQVLPKHADMFTFWATVPGYAAVRHKKDGSWFIQSFCKQMEDLGNKVHFADICASVINEVTKKKWSTPEGDVNVTTPMVVNTLRKSFFLPTIRKI